MFCDRKYVISKAKLLLNPLMVNTKEGVLSGICIRGANSHAETMFNHSYQSYHNCEFYSHFSRDTAHLVLFAITLGRIELPFKAPAMTSQFGCGHQGHKVETAEVKYKVFP